MYDAVCEVGHVTVVAPVSEMSAVGHAITIAVPLRVKPYNKNGSLFGYAVDGTPADCVKIAYSAILKEKEKPDLIISGINLGSNSGINAIYSGTVSAATEGAILGIPSFAISLATYHDPDFGLAAKFAQKLAGIVIEEGLPQGTYLNVNVPHVPEKDLKGIVVTRQGQAIFNDGYEMRRDPFGRNYYWLTGSKINIEEDECVDDRAILQNKISITPIHYDLTNYSFLDKLRTWNFE